MMLFHISFRNAIADERLVVTSRNAAEQETVEVVHEALIRNWSQLRDWMTKDRLFRAWQERLRAAMHQWEETKRDEGALLRGLPLVEAEEKLKERQEELSLSEQDFIQQSVEVRKRLYREEKNRRQRVFVGGSAAVLTIMVILGGAAFNQSRQAKLNSEKARNYSFGFVSAQKGDNKNAMYFYQQALNLDPNDAYTHYGLGAIRNALGDKNGAIADYDKALHLKPNLAIVYNDRGIVRSDLGDKKGAIEDYEKALQINPKLGKYKDKIRAKLSRM